MVKIAENLNTLKKLNDFRIIIEGIFYEVLIISVYSEMLKVSFYTQNGGALSSNFDTFKPW